jgi:hypothetical protein
LVSFDGYEPADAGGGSSEMAHAGESGAAASGRSGAGGGSAGKPANEGGASLGDAGSSGAASGGRETGGAGSAGAGAANGGAGSTSGGAANGGAGFGGGGTSGSASGGAGAGGMGMSGGGSAGSAGSAGAGGAPMHCPSGTTNRVSSQIPLAGGGFYCIDHAEVRNSDYKAFLDANPGAPSGQIAACAFNTSYAPLVTATCSQYDPANKPNSPIACVDWCDAAAFCKWDGKHLCGKIGGGSNAQADFVDAAKSEWYRACSHAGLYDYPYGNQYNGDKCAGLDNISAVHPLATPQTSCVGGYDDLYDMSGNVAEWEDSCAGSSGASDACLYRGGSYLDSSAAVNSSTPSLQCNSNVHGSPQIAAKARSARDPETGFRCCSEALPGAF